LDSNVAHHQNFPEFFSGLLEMTSQYYLTPTEAAQYLRSSKSTLAKLRVYGGGPDFCRIGKAIRYRRSDLDAFMLARRVRSTSEPVTVRAEDGPIRRAAEQPDRPADHLTGDRAIKIGTDRRRGSRDERKEGQGR
jgi:excisionase family DNA binding protein